MNVPCVDVLSWIKSHTDTLSEEARLRLYIINSSTTHQRSAVWSYGFSSTSSGDIYNGVP